MQVSAVISPSPSFSSYSNSNLVDVAARVVQEEYEKTTTTRVYESEIDGGREEEEFEFAFESLPQVSADEIFHNGIILPLYPNLLLGNTRYHGSVDESRMNSGLLKGVKIGTPLRKLFTAERETSTSCSSSEADELYGVSAEMYCVWRPKPSAEGRLKKSSSTGWKFKGFLQKSHSVGSNDSFAIATLDMDNGGRKRDECVMESPVSQHGVWRDDDFLCSSSSRTASKCMQPPHKKDGEKRRSYLLYRHDLVGYFANVNKLSKNFHPF